MRVLPRFVAVRSFPIWVCPNCWILKVYRRQPREPQLCTRCARVRLRSLSDVATECGLDFDALEGAYRLGGTGAMREMIESAWDELSQLQTCNDYAIPGR